MRATAAALLALAVAAANASDCVCPPPTAGAVWQACGCKMERLFRWFQEQGGRVGPLEYRDGGMYATEDVAQGQLLVEAPYALLFPMGRPDNLIHADVAAALQSPSLDLRLRYGPWLDALPWACQTPMCGAPTPPGLNVTVLLQPSLAIERARVPPSMAVAYSLVASRTWQGGMLPVMDLFNHHATRAAPVAFNGTHVTLRAGAATGAGQELFLHYGTHSSASWLLQYNMLQAGEGDTCVDKLVLRHPAHTPAQRLECAMAHDFGTLHKAAAVLAEAAAAEQPDLVLVKGVAHWLDTHIHIV